MSDPIEPPEQGSGAFGAGGRLSVFRPWRWASEWLLDLWDDLLDRLDWPQESGGLRFLRGLIFGLALGAGLMWFWAPGFQPLSADHVAEGASESASVTRSQARRPDVVVDVVPSAGRLQVNEPALIASEAAESDTVIEVETFLAELETLEPDPDWQVPVSTLR